MQVDACRANETHIFDSVAECTAHLRSPVESVTLPNGVTLRLRKTARAPRPARTQSRPARSGATPARGGPNYVNNSAHQVTSEVWNNIIGRNKATKIGCYKCCNQDCTVPLRQTPAYS